MTEENTGLDRRTFVERAGALGLLAMTGGVTSALAGCGGDDDAGAPTGGADVGQAVRGGRAVLATVDIPVNMDPADGQLYSSLQVYQNIFHSLLDVDADFKFQPGIAQEWTQEDDTTWTLELVDNAVFHNGEPVTAEDVRFTLDRMKEHPLSVFVAAFDRVEVLGDHRCRVHLSAPYGAVEASMAAIIEVVNQKGIESGDPKLKPVGCGPYQMTEWVQGDHVTLQRWDQYFKQDKPYLDEIVFRAIGDESVRLTGLQTGELDWIQRVPPQRVEELEASSELKSSEGRPYNPDMIWFNTTRPPFNDVRVRQAVAWAVNRAEIVNLVWFGTAVEATEAISPPNPWHTGENPYDGGPDLDEARSLLREAGVDNVDVTFLGQPQVPTQVRTGEVLRSQLAEIGINVRIQNFEPAQWFERLATKNFDLTTSYFSATLDPAHFYYPVCLSGSPWNFTGIESERIDSALNSFAFNTNQDARKDAYREVVLAVAEEAPIVSLANEVQRYWMKPVVHGSIPLPSLEVRVEDMWREDA